MTEYCNHQHCLAQSQLGLQQHRMSATVRGHLEVCHLWGRGVKVGLVTENSYQGKQGSHGTLFWEVSAGTQPAETQQNKSWQYPRVLCIPTLRVNTRQRQTRTKKQLG